MGDAKWNPRNTAVKRIVQELKEIEQDDNPDMVAEALEENIFEWHFVIRGAWDTEFEGGIYHGRILMPAEYPFKPPAFVMMTPSGRFETGTKICLSISSYHPESWQPSWSVRSALVALIAFMQTPGNGAVGSLDHSAEVRRQIAVEARATPPKHANADRQELINRLHQRMIDLEKKSRALYTQTADQQLAVENAEASQELVVSETPAEPHPASPAQPASPEQAIINEGEGEGDSQASAGPSSPIVPPLAGVAQQYTSSPPPEPLPKNVAASPAPPVASPAPITPPAPTSVLHFRDRSASATIETSPQQTAAIAPMLEGAVVPAHSMSWEDRGLTFLALLLMALIATVLLRRVVVSFRPQTADGMFSVNPMGDIDMEL